MTHSDLVCLAGTQHCCLHIVLQLTMAEILLHCEWVAAYLAPLSFHVSNFLILVVYILSHNFLIHISLQWQNNKNYKKNHKWWEIAENMKYYRLKKKSHIYVVHCSTKMYTVCCINLATCSDLLLRTLMLFPRTTPTTPVSSFSLRKQTIVAYAKNSLLLKT